MLLNGRLTWGAVWKYALTNTREYSPTDGESSTTRQSRAEIRLWSGLVCDWASEFGVQPKRQGRRPWRFLFPLDHLNGCSTACLGVQLEFVHQPLGAREADPQTFASGAAVAQGLIDVGNSRTLIASQNEHAFGSIFFVHHGEGHFPALSVIDDVASDFANGCANEGEIAASESQLHGKVAAVLTSG